MSKKTEWEKEFDKRFVYKLDPNADDYGWEKFIDKTSPVSVKGFISDFLAKEKMELVERIERMKNTGVCPKYQGHGNCNQRGCSWCGSYLRNNDDAFNAYNQALDNVISALKSEEKEEVLV